MMQRLRAFLRSISRYSLIATRHRLGALITVLASAGMIGQQLALISAGLIAMVAVPTTAEAARVCSFSGLPTSFTWIPTSPTDGPVWWNTVVLNCNGSSGVYFCYGSNFNDANDGHGHTIQLSLSANIDGQSVTPDVIRAGDSTDHGNYDTGNRNSSGGTSVTSEKVVTDLLLMADPYDAPPAAGTYTTSIPLVYDMNGAQSCDSYAAGVAGTASTDSAYSGGIPVTITVPYFCSVSSSTAVAFGSVSSTLSAVNGSAGAVSVLCNGAASYTIGLGQGSNYSGSTRRMKGTVSGSAYYLPYKLYKDSNRSTEWTTSATVSGTGAAPPGGSTGSSVSTSVYGQIPAGTSLPPAGSYSDSVTVTVTY